MRFYKLFSLFAFFFPLLLSVENSAHAQPQTIQIPYSLLESAPNGATDTTPFNSDFRNYDLEKLSLDFSAWIYTIPDLEDRKEPEALALAFKKAVQNIPYHYKIIYLSSNPESGLKFALLAPPSGQNTPWVLAFAGTETLVDWISDLNFASTQVKNLEPLFSFLNQFDKTIINNSYSLLVTGHSLGGALAQYVAYNLSYSTQQWSGPLELITWNAPGAKQLIDYFHGKEISNSIVNPCKVLFRTHFFVEGDPVSRIGKHWGKTYKITPKFDSSFPFLKSPIHFEAVDQVSAHLLKTIIDSDRLTLGGAIQNACVAEPKTFEAATNALKFRYLFDHTNEDLFFFKFRTLTKKYAQKTADLLKKNPSPLNTGEANVGAEYFLDIADWTEQRIDGTFSVSHAVDRVQIKLQQGVTLFKQLTQQPQ